VRVKDLFNYGLSGTDGAKAPHIKRAQYLLREIDRRFGPRTQDRLHCKHLGWFLRRHLAGTKPCTQYTYWSTIWRLCHLLGKQNWIPLLGGPWEYRDGVAKPDRHPGGRPRKVPAAVKIEASRKESQGTRKKKIAHGRRRRRSRDEET
jgi:hypothetical protein